MIEFRGRDICWQTPSNLIRSWSVSMSFILNDRIIFICVALRFFSIVLPNVYIQSRSVAIGQTVERSLLVIYIVTFRCVPIYPVFGGREKKGLRIDRFFICYISCWYFEDGRSVVRVDETCFGFSSVCVCVCMWWGRSRQTALIRFEVEKNNNDNQFLITNLHPFLNSRFNWHVDRKKHSSIYATVYRPKEKVV